MSGTQISFSSVGKTYSRGRSKNEVIRGVDLEIAAGEFVVFVGPSGCGKSTLLRMVAGLEGVTAGEISFDGKRVNELSPQDRGVGIVFQSYALYPHMTVRQNIAFPLKMRRRKQPGVDEKAAVEDIAEMLEITPLLEKKPGQLSGGQRQRVAIGRALVRKPRVFLLDEPLSNLDAALRARMRLTLAEYHQKLGCTVIYVTHDQIEATTLADTVVVLNRGVVEQAGSPMSLYHFPKTRFVAEFVGSPKMNMLEAQVVGQREGLPLLQIGDDQFTADVGIHSMAGWGDGPVFVGVRPENIRIVGSGGQLSAKVLDQEFHGAESLVYAEVAGSKDPFLVRTPGSLVLTAGQTLRLELPADRLMVFNAEGEAAERNASLEDLIDRGPAATAT